MPQVLAIPFLVVQCSLPKVLKVTSGGGVSSTSRTMRHGLSLTMGTLRCNSLRRTQAPHRPSRQYSCPLHSARTCLPDASRRFHTLPDARFQMPSRRFQTPSRHFRTLPGKVHDLPDASRRALQTPSRRFQTLADTRAFQTLPDARAFQTLPDAPSRRAFQPLPAFRLRIVLSYLTYFVGWIFFCFCCCYLLLFCYLLNFQLP